jgi:hypothetical protein
MLVLYLHTPTFIYAIVLKVWVWVQGWRPWSVKKIIVVKSKEVKIKSNQIWKNLRIKDTARKGLFRQCWLIRQIPYFGKMDVVICDLHDVCLLLYACDSLLINFLSFEPNFTKLGIYGMAVEPVSSPHFINLSLLGEDFPTSSGNFWRRRFLCSSCCIVKGK